MQLLDNIIRELEIWSNENAISLFESVPAQSILDHVRRDWITGVSLATIRINEQEADNISKDYYGYTLPWIIHAISQMFDSASEENIVQIYSNIAMFVELGLPNEIAANIYMAGVRSRSVALELSMLENLQDKSVSEIKKILIDFSSQSADLSENAQVWIDLLSGIYKAQKPYKVVFPNFKWEGKGLPEKLYPRECNGKYYLTSFDGYFQERVDSTDDLPFSSIANIYGLYFEKDQDIWQLKSYNPFNIVE